MTVASLLWCTTLHAANADLQAITIQGTKLVGEQVQVRLTVKNLSPYNNGFNGVATFCFWCEVDPPGVFGTFTQSGKGEIGYQKTVYVTMPSFLLDDDGTWAVDCEVRDWQCSGVEDSGSTSFYVNKCYDYCVAGEDYCTSNSQAKICVEQANGCLDWETVTCAGSQKCQSGDCVDKTCDDYGAYDECSCFWDKGDTACEAGEGLGDDGYLCQDKGPVCCWVKMSNVNCSNSEYCYEMGWSGTPTCVECYEDFHCGIDVCVDYECVECDSDADCYGQICHNNQCVDCVDDGDCPDDFVEEEAPYCPNADSVVKKVTTHDFYCGGNTCQHTQDTETLVLASDGDDDFCELADDYCGGCAHGKFACHFDSECGPLLICGGGLFGLLCWGPECGCCHPGETWDEAKNLCVECVDNGDCDDPTPICLDNSCVSCTLDSHCPDDEELAPEYDCGNGDTVTQLVTTVDYYCAADNTCKTISDVTPSTVASLGNDDFCEAKSEYCQEDCTEGQYGCNSDSECLGTLDCNGSWPLLGCVPDSCGCCPQGKLWDTTLKTCVIDCDKPCEVPGENKCDGDDLLTCTD